MSDAELLIDIAEAILHPRDELLVSVDNPPETAEIAALALRLRERPGLALRALVEEWTRVRIVRELY